MKYLAVLFDAALVFLIAKVSFDYFSGKESLLLLDVAPAGVILIYSIGYFMIMEIGSHAAQMYRILVGSFVVLAMIIHGSTINFFLDGEAVWKTIALIVTVVTLFSTQYLTYKLAELDL